MILILSDKHDAHADSLEERLKELNYLNYFRLNLDVASLQKTLITYKNQIWNIEFNKRKITSQDVTCVWSRRNFVELLIEEEYDQTADFKIWKGEWNRALLGLYLALKQCKWLNPIKTAYQAENKYFQLEVANEIGFKQPPIIVSNNKEDLMNFSKSHERLALKMMEQGFYKTEQGELRGLYVNKISSEHLSTFGDSHENPIVLQKYIDKLFEVRYTVVGDKHFVCRIDSQRTESTQTDWRRYNLPQTPHLIIEAPDDIRKKVSILMNKLELFYGALDFIVTPENEWYFLEVNSMGQYLWIEDLTGLQITNAIVSWLISHT